MSNVLDKKKVKKKNNDLVFMCKKCDHKLFITDGLHLEGMDLVYKLMAECPNCGEEPQDLWIFSGTGNYKKEYGS